MRYTPSHLLTYRKPSSEFYAPLLPLLYNAGPDLKELFL